MAARKMIFGPLLVIACAVWLAIAMARWSAPLSDWVEVQSISVPPVVAPFSTPVATLDLRAKRNVELDWRMTAEIFVGERWLSLCAGAGTVFVPENTNATIGRAAGEWLNPQCAQFSPGKYRMRAQVSLRSRSLIEPDRSKQIFSNIFIVEGQS